MRWEPLVDLECPLWHKLHLEAHIWEMGGGSVLKEECVEQSTELNGGQNQTKMLNITTDFSIVLGPAV